MLCSGPNVGDTNGVILYARVNQFTYFLQTSCRLFGNLKIKNNNFNKNYSFTLFFLMP
jgi:hypothetical protein